MRFATSNDASFIETQVMSLRGKMTFPKSKERLWNIYQNRFILIENTVHEELTFTKDTDENSEPPQAQGSLLLDIYMPSESKKDVTDPNWYFALIPELPHECREVGCVTVPFHPFEIWSQCIVTIKEFRAVDKIPGSVPILWLLIHSSTSERTITNTTQFLQWLGRRPALDIPRCWPKPLLQRDPH